MSLMLLLLACGPPRIEDQPDTRLPEFEDSGVGDTTPDETGETTDDTGAAGETGTTAPDDTGGVETIPDVIEEEIEDQELSDSWFFSNEAIQTIEITLSSESWNNLQFEPYEYTEAGVAVNGEFVETVGVRLRGKYGSFRDLNGKPKFKIDFNQYLEGQRFYGIETISLNNEVVDCSYLKEPIGYALFEEMAVPAPRTGFAEVTVNGAPYGLYVIVETPDDRFLERAYEEPDGNLYDGKYILDELGNFVALLDFGDGVDDLFQLEEGTDVGNADIIAVSDAHTGVTFGDSYYEAMSPYIDWENFHRLWAVEQWLGQNDGYVLNTNNYRVYFDPADGLAKFVPWDLDYTFLYDYEWGMDWWGPAGNIAARCLRDEACAAAQKAATAEVIAAAESAGLSAQFAAMQPLIADAAAADPRKECSDRSVEREQDAVEAWLTQRSDELRSEWGLP